MPFSKAFPKRVEGSNYPSWEEVFLSDEEEKAVSSDARKENVKLMKECIEDAKKIVAENNLNDSNIASIARTLFDKRASHEIYWKEEKAKEKFTTKISHERSGL